jgi:hypothetical protein
MTQPIDYRTPLQAPINDLRLKAVRHARGNGIGCIILGACAGSALALLPILTAAPTTAGTPRAAPPPALLGLLLVLLGGYSLLFLASGIIHLVGSFKIRTPNRTWELLITIAAWIHIIFLVLWIILLILSMAASGRVNVIPLLFAFAIMFSLGQGAQKIRAATQAQA